MSALRARLAFFAFFAMATIAPLRPVRDYDYFWHLAAGRWIHEHGAVPRTDPFGAASDPGPWVDGEWLFQSLIYFLSPGGMAIARALFIGALFTALLVWTTRVTKSLGLSLGLCTISWFGAIWAFSERPATFATAFVVLAVWLTLREPKPLLYALLTIVWINFHPSALLAPLIALIGAGAYPANRRLPTANLVTAALSALALLINPYGLQAILAPIRLTQWVTSGVFHNIEWQPASPVTHPILFLMIALGFLAFAFDRDRRAHVPHILLLALFSALAIRFLRNHGMFYSVWPLLIAPMLPPLSNERLQKLVAVASFVFFGVFLLSRRPAIGVDEQWLPVRAAARLKALHPPGNIFAASHFGGVLIWTFYPERRVVNDGRNELYHTLLVEYARARRDPRAWRALLNKYRIATAVVDPEPAIRSLYPPTEWALIAYDDAALVFARREAWKNALPPSRVH